MSVPEIDGYSDLVRIGSGGFSTVYLANQDAFSRQVALKVLNAVETDPETIRRFERECQSAGSLSWHPNIVVVFDAGVTTDRRPYLAMQHLPGGSLAEATAERPMTWDEASVAVIQTADALGAAHDAGLLHRDVKPENVLRDRFGDCRLGDFGIAAVHGAQETATGVVTASIGHAAPEILGGKRATVSADVYSLGSMMFALLTGRPAFYGRGQTVAQVIGRVINEPIGDLRSLGVPDIVAEAVEKAMAKVPEDRFPSALAFGEALQQAQLLLGVSVTPMRSPDAGPEEPDRTSIGQRAPIGMIPGSSTPPTTPEGDDQVRQPTAVFDPLAVENTPTALHTALPDELSSAAGRKRWLLPVVLGLLTLALVIMVVWLVFLSDGDETGVQAPPSVDSSPSTSQDDDGGPGTSVIPADASQALDLARELASAIADDNWDAAASIDIAKASWTIEQWEFGYGALDRSELVEFGTTDQGDGSYRLDLGLVAYEIDAADDQVTRLFCVTWISDPTRRVVEQTTEASELTVRVGWIPLTDAESALLLGC